MVTTSRTSWLSGPVSDENGRGAVERILDRSPSVMPVRGFGAQSADTTRPVRRQREQIYDLDVTIAEEFGCSADSAESPGSGGRGRIGEDADECAARGRQRYRLHYRLICQHAIGGVSLPRLPGSSSRANGRTSSFMAPCFQMRSRVGFEVTHRGGKLFPQALCT